MMPKIPLRLMTRRAGTKRKRIVIRTRDPLKRDRDRLMAIYMQVVRHWQQAIPGIVAAYERLAEANRVWDSAPLIDRPMMVDSAEEIAEAIEAEEGWFARVSLNLQSLISDWVGAMEWWQRSRWASAIFSATAVPIDTMLSAGDVQGTLDDTIAYNLSLIKDVDAQQARRMKEIVYRGYQSRMTAREVAKELQAVTGFGRQRALLIASVEQQKLVAVLDRERMAQAGITNALYKHSKKSHPRLWHKARDGKEYVLETRTSVDGKDTIAKDDMPGIAIRCGCGWEAILDLDAKEAELEAAGELMSQEELNALMSA